MYGYILSFETNTWNKIKGERDSQTLIYPSLYVCVSFVNTKLPMNTRAGNVVKKAPLDKTSNPDFNGSTQLYTPSYSIIEY